MANNKTRRYLLLSSLGFVVVIALGLFLFEQFRGMVWHHTSSSREIHQEHIERLYEATLDKITEYIEIQYPVLHDTERFKREAWTEWFWNTADELNAIADIYQLPCICFIVKSGAEYRYLVSSGLQRYEIPEWFSRPVWEGPPPAFVNEALETGRLTLSPLHADNELDGPISAVRPIMADGDVLGLLGIYDDVSSLDHHLRHQDSHIEEQESQMMFGMRIILLAVIAVILLFLCYQLWLGNKTLVPMQDAEADERTRLMLEATPMMCSLWDSDGQIIDCDGETLKIMGLSKKSDYIENFFKLNPEYQPNGELTSGTVSRVVRETLETGYQRFEWLTHTAAGEPIPLEATAVRVPWKNSFRLAVYSRDLREEKVKEAALQEIKNRLRVMLDTMALACLFFDPEGNLIDCNQRTVDLFGYEHTTEMLGKFKDLSPEYQPDGRESYEKAMELRVIAVDTGEAVFHWIHQKRDGTPLPAEVTLIRVPWKDNYRIVSYVRDLSELIETEKNLTRVLATVESSPNIVLNLDKNGNIEYMNPAFVDVAGFSREELQRDGLALVLSPGDLACLNREYVPAALKDKITKFEIQIITKTAERREYAFSAFAVSPQTGNTGVGMLGRDVTELKRMNLDLKAAKDQAERALASEIQYNKAKSDFLSRVSHELRTPLNAIVGMTSIAKTTTNADELSHCWANIDEAIEHLLELVNDVLDMTGFDTGSFNFFSHPFSFSKLMASVIDNVTRKAQAKEQIFIADIDSGIHEWMDSDERRLKQILLKLLSNAVKFTPGKGKIELHARMIENSGKGCTIRFDVVDNGAGISNEILERMWDVFEQADTSTTREHGGLGLSLTLVKRIVDLMRGELRVESEMGKGSRFTCDVRLGVVKDGLGTVNDETQQGENTGGAVQYDSLNLSGKRVMIVDDVSLNREILLMLLEHTGAVLDEASTGDEAVRMFGRDKYDLVLMDLHMPVMDGYVATKNIRASAKPWAKSVPVIAISAESSGDIHSKCMEAGITDHLSKPVEIEDLLKTIAKWMPSGTPQ